MTNRARGYAAVKIGDESFDLSLHLGALAEIEDEFKVEAFEDGLNFGDKVSAKRLRKILFGLLRGNDVELTPMRLKAINGLMPADVVSIINEVASAGGLNNASQDSEKGSDSRPLEALNAGGLG